MKNALFVPVLFASLSIIFFSCTSTPAGQKNRGSSNTGSTTLAGTVEDKPTITPSAVRSGEGTVLSVPSREELNRNSPDSIITALLETGTPISLREAVSRIQQDSRGMTDQNRISLFIANEVMKIVYPLEGVQWSVPAVPEDNAHIQALRSVRKGQYDLNTGNADFLALVLPSLVFMTNAANATTDYEQDAIVSLQKAIALKPTSVLPMVVLARIFENRSSDDLSYEWNLKAWNLDSSCYPAGEGLARAFLRRKENTLAFEIAKKLSETYPSATSLHQLAAQAAFAAGNWDLADTYIIQVLKVEPSNSAFLLMRATILIERKEYLRAASLLDAFATINKTDRIYLLLRSRILREWNKNFASAIGVLQEAQLLYPSDPEVLLASAQVSFQTSQSINGLSSRDFIFKVLQSDATNVQALSLLANDYIRQGEWQNAIKTSEQLLLLNPTTEAELLLIRSRLGASQASLALPLAKSVYERVGSEESLSLYLQALLDSRSTATAEALIARQLDKATPSISSMLYYYTSKLTQDKDKELSALRSSLLSDPRNLKSLFSMYQWYFDKADYRKAQYYLKQVVALDSQNNQYGRLLSELDKLLAR